MRGGPSVDHLIRAQQQRWRNREAEGFGGFLVYDELELRRLLDRKVAGFGTLEDFVNVDCDAAEQSRVVWPVRHEQPGVDVFSSPADTRQTMLDGQLGYTLSLTKIDGDRRDDDAVDVLSRHLRKGLLEVIGRADAEDTDSQIERARGGQRLAKARPRRHVAFHQEKACS